MAALKQKYVANLMAIGASSPRIGRFDLTVEEI